jgi:hypothetical protein
MFIFVISLLVSCSVLLATSVHAEVIDRIVAIVNNEIILQSEFTESLQAAKKSDPGVSGDKVLGDMIDRILILEQAKKLRLESSSEPNAPKDDEALVKEYIERRIRAFIHIPIEEIESYYNDNRMEFGDHEFYDVKDDIEDRLVEVELKKKLVEHLAELRKKAYVRVQLGN